MSDKKKEGNPDCPHLIGFTVEEEDALNRLQHSLTAKARECSPLSRMSSVAHVAIGKLIKKANTLHDTVHKLEAELHEAELLIEGIAGMPQSLGLVKDKDLN